MSEWQAVMRSGGITIRRRATVSAPRVTGEPVGLNLAKLGHAIVEHVRSAWTWLERKRTSHLAARRLHVAETLSLGEKRFVSIIEVDGTQYLIGGSAENVQLLSRLEDNEPMALPVRHEREVRS